MRTISLNFQVHPPLRLRTYRFFDIGNDHYYYDDFTNESRIRRKAERCYLPTNTILLDTIKEYGSRFKVSFVISGTAIDLFKLYAPEVLDSFRELVKTGCVELLSEPISHSLVSLIDQETFKQQLNEHSDIMYKHFKQRPKTLVNTALLYSNAIGEMAYEIGYKTVLTEATRHILGWKSPNYVYFNASNPKQKILFRNCNLSDDLSLRFNTRNWSEYPLTAEKYARWIKNIDPKEEHINIFIDYETFGEIHAPETGIINFLKALPKTIFSETEIGFCTCAEAAERLQPVGGIDVPYPITWADAEKDTSAFLGNDMQQEAFAKLQMLNKAIEKITDKGLRKDWKYLQAADHLYYMSTKFFAEGRFHSMYNPYSSPYEAFINYMNVLNDMLIQVENYTGGSIGIPTTTGLKAVTDKETSTTKTKKTKEKSSTVKEREKKKKKVNASTPKTTKEKKPVKKN